MLKKIATVACITAVALAAHTSASANNTGTESFLAAVGNKVSFGSDGYGTFAGSAAGTNFHDTIDFTNLLSNQLYKVKLNFSGFDLGLGLTATLTGAVTKNVNILGDGEIDFGYLKTTASSSGSGIFTLDIYAPNALSSSVYNGSFYALAVPEPTAAAMLIAGLAVMGFVAMRRRQD